MRSLLNITVVYISTLALIFSQVIPAYAGFIDTEQFMVEQQVDQNREALRKVLDRDEAQYLLRQHGVSIEQAQERVAAMTDAEVRVFAQKFEELPAAGHVGAVILILVLLVVILALAR